MPPTYQDFCRDRQTSTLAVEYYLPFIQREELHLETNGEMIWASVHINGYTTLYLGVFYRHRRGISLLDKQCLNELELSISRHPNNCHIILAGD